MSRDLLKYNPSSSNFQLSSQSSGNHWSSIATRPSDSVRVKETAKKKTVVTPRRYTTTETLTRTVDINPQGKRKAAEKKPSPKRARMEVSTKTKSGSKKSISTSPSRVSCSKEHSSSEESISYSSETYSVDSSYSDD